MNYKIIPVEEAGATLDSGYLETPKVYLIFMLLFYWNFADLAHKRVYQTETEAAKMMRIILQYE